MIRDQARDSYKKAPPKRGKYVPWTKARGRQMVMLAVPHQRGVRSPSLFRKIPTATGPARFRCQDQKFSMSRLLWAIREHST